jgi:hypothetical protein
MRNTVYQDLNINQKINCKGFDEADNNLFKRDQRYSRMFRMLNITILWPDKLANELLTIKFTKQGYKNY